MGSATVLACLGLKAAFDSHSLAVDKEGNSSPIPHTYSLHSWCGMITISLAVAQVGPYHYQQPITEICSGSWDWSPSSGQAWPPTSGPPSSPSTSSPASPSSSSPVPRLSWGSLRRHFSGSLITTRLETEDFCRISVTVSTSGQVCRGYPGEPSGDEHRPLLHHCGWHSS